MFIHLLSGLIFVYLLCRFVLPLKVGRTVKMAAGIILLLVSQQHLFNRYLFGGLASPELPSGMLIFQGWCFISLLFLLLLVLLRDLLAFAGWIARRGKRRPQSKFSQGRRQALLVLAAAAPAAYGVYKAVAAPEARSMELILPRLPQEMDGLALVQISDLHVSPLLRTDRVREVVHRVNSLNPDLILLTGDIVDGPPGLRAPSVAPLRELQSRYGVFACVGNHEYYSGFEAWMAAFPRLGITVLQNSHVIIPIRNRKLVIAGVTDIAAGRYSLPLPDCAAALSGAPEDAPRILLEHRPVNARANALRNIDLQLSGHTHGGQMLGMSRLVARFNEKYVYGWYKEGNMNMYVSSGAGLWNGFPVRLGVPSEIPRIILRSL